MLPCWTSSSSSFWLSPVMPCNSASTSSCERICWFMGWARSCRRRPTSLDDEGGVVHVRDRVVHRGLALLLAFLRLGRLVGVLVLDLDAQRQHGLAHHFLGELNLAVTVEQLLRG